jgi:hypothetical protein
MNNDIPRKIIDKNEYSESILYSIAAHNKIIIVLQTVFCDLQ